MYLYSKRNSNSIVKKKVEKQDCYNISITRQGLKVSQFLYARGSSRMSKVSEQCTEHRNSFSILTIDD